MVRHHLVMEVVGLCNSVFTLKLFVKAVVNSKLFLIKHDTIIRIARDNVLLHCFCVSLTLYYIFK